MLIRNNASNLILRLGQIQTNSVYSMNFGVNYLGLTEKVLPCHPRLDPGSRVNVQLEYKILNISPGFRV